LFLRSDIAPLETIVNLSDSEMCESVTLIIIIMVRVVDVTLNIMLTEKMSECLHVINWEPIDNRPTKTFKEGENSLKIEKLAQKTIACQSGINMNKVNACITESTVVVMT